MRWVTVDTATMHQFIDAMIKRRQLRITDHERSFRDYALTSVLIRLFRAWWFETHSGEYVLINSQHFTSTLEEIGYTRLRRHGTHWTELMILG